MRRQRRGNAITNLGITLGGLAFCALVVDVGWYWTHQERIQSLNDAVATAAASQLDSSLGGIERAEQAALEVMQTNDYFGSPALGTLYAGPQDLEFGYWITDPGGGAYDTDRFVRVNVASAALEDINTVTSVRVRSTDPEVRPLLAGMILGSEPKIATSTSTAVNGKAPVSGVGCYLPVGIPLCHFNQSDLESAANIDFSFDQNAPNRVAWGMMPENGGPDSVGPQPTFPRSQEALARDCDMLGPSDPIFRVNSRMNFTQGLQQSTVNHVRALLGAPDADLWPEEMGPIPPGLGDDSTHPNPGRVVQAPVFIFDGGPGYCNGTAGPWNGNERTVGIAWGVIYDINHQQSGQGRGRDMSIRLDFARMKTILGEAGGSDFDFSLYARTVTQLVE
ncbi:MAG: hypothetical protein EA397_15880 [Deltaproteobacteria bacterium]|nr:MAG: hypothetical protein EA397_15880 [Deltaproteobacteria bacterium]